MKRYSISLALLTVLALVQPASVVRAAGCMPDPALDALCPTLAIPQTACRTVVARPEVPPEVKNARICEKIPNGYSSTGQDANIIYLGQGLVHPNDMVKVGIGKYIYIQNVDSVGHTFSDPGCLDSVSGTPCRFHIGLGAGEVGIFAKKLFISNTLFTAPKVYSFRCALPAHAAEVGTFEVTA